MMLEYRRCKTLSSTYSNRLKRAQIHLSIMGYTVLIYIRDFTLKVIVLIGLIFFLFMESAVAKPLVVRTVTVASRQDAETILTRMRRDTPLPTGAKGIGQVRVLSQKQVAVLPRFLRDTIRLLKVGEHTRIIRENESYSIYQVTTFENYLQAQSFYEQGKIRGAVQKIEKDLIINPDHIRSLALLGRIFEERGEYDRAAEGYRQLIVFNPGSPFGFQKIGRIHEIEKRWDQAVENYEISLEIDSEQHEVLNNLALIYAVHRNQIERGVRLIKKALRLQPNFKKYQDTLLKLREMKVARSSILETRQAKKKGSNSVKTDLIKNENLHRMVKQKPTSSNLRRELPVPPNEKTESHGQIDKQEKGKRLHEVRLEISTLVVMNPSLQIKKQNNQIKILKLLGLMK